MRREGWQGRVCYVDPFLGQERPAVLRPGPGHRHVGPRVLGVCAGSLSEARHADLAADDDRGWYGNPRAKTITQEHLGTQLRLSTRDGRGAHAIELRLCLQVHVHVGMAHTRQVHTSSLSETGSRKAPSGEVTRHFRARYLSQHGRYDPSLGFGWSAR